MPSEAESAATKRAIVERKARGERVTEIAEDLGVSRAYAYFVLKGSKEQGGAVPGMQKRGRPKEHPLSEQEDAELLQAITATKPAEHGIASEAWREPEIKKWFFAKYERTISLNQIRRFLTAHQLRLRPVDDEISSDILASEEAFEISAEEHEGRAARRGSSDQDFDYEAIKKSVESTRESLAEKNISFDRALHGQKTSKHRKQR
ncbi:MAG: hypothetical protein AAF212_10915, partial [Verrucomicrobiota bacterium]